MLLFYVSFLSLANESEEQDQVYMSTTDVCQKKKTKKRDIILDRLTKMKQT